MQSKKKKDNPVDKKDNPADKKDNPVDKKDNPVDKKDNSVDKKGNSVDKKGNPIDKKVNPVEKKGPAEKKGPVDKKGSRVEKKANPSGNVTESDPTTGNISADKKDEHHPHQKSDPASSGSRGHKPKRAKPPPKFHEWPQEDKDRYNEVTIQLRRWKATKQQCFYMRKNLSQWQALKSMFSTSQVYQAELHAYSKTKKDIDARRGIAGTESFDLPPFEK